MNRRALLGSLFAGGVFACMPAPAGATTGVPSRPDAIKRTLEEWKVRLTSEQYRVLFEKGTERAFTGTLWDNHADGVYLCAACGLDLFDSTTKFESGTGWPSFYQPVAADRLLQVTDDSWLYTRTEVMCNRCGGHQGHVFPDGPKPTGLRYCINSVALRFRPRAAPVVPSAG